MNHRPEEPFSSLWGESCCLGENLDTVTLRQDPGQDPWLVVVHFNDQAGELCDLDQVGWELRRQQLAWTVRTATGSKAPVRVTVGKDDYVAERGVVAQRKYLGARPSLEHGVGSPKWKRPPAWTGLTGTDNTSIYER